MASGRYLCRLLGKKIHYQSPTGTLWPSMLRLYSKRAESAGGKSVKGLTLAGVGLSGILSLMNVAYADEGDHVLAYPSYPWPNNDVLKSYDISWEQRDKQIFRHDCASCHGGLFSHKERAGVANNERENQVATAAEIEVPNGNSDEGRVYACPGKFSSQFPQPYATGQEASLTSGKPYPCDINLITKVCCNGQNHVLDLLNVFQAPGVSMPEGLRKNACFSNSAIAMPKIISNGSLKFEDGINTTGTQMAKGAVALLSSA